MEFYHQKRNTAIDRNIGNWLITQITYKNNFS